MKKYYHLLIISGTIALLSGCASGKKALQKGDYEKAVTQAINRLRSNDGQKKAKATLANAYKYALESHLGNIKTARASNDIMKWEVIARNYQYINFLADEIQRCPGCRQVVPKPSRYDAELTDAKNKAAEVHYNLGVEALRKKDQRIKAIEAHQHFQAAQALAPRFKDVEEKLEESLYFATLRVVVEPIPSPSRMFEIRHEFFVNKINEYLHNNMINQYVRFFTPGEVNSQKLDYVDHIITMEFDRFNLGNIYSNKTTTDVSRDSVVIATRNNEKIYGTVKAKLTTNEKAITGTGVLDFKVFDNGLKKVLTQEKFPSEYTWAIRWASFNGDERALSDEELKMVNTVEASAPSPQFMFEEFTAPLYNQAISKIRDYYRNY
ncbi:MAG: hypothetical protein RIG68_19910 [Imperialibacter sp.]|uniref:hypothetical protein n=1 Tax=Imperialibacter sp. TaxID=2038411 RepID=UPI0032EE81BD